MQKVTGSSTELVAGTMQDTLIAGTATFASLGAKRAGQPKGAGFIHSSYRCAWPRFYRTDTLRPQNLSSVILRLKLSGFDGSGLHAKEFGSVWG